MAEVKRLARVLVLSLVLVIGAAAVALLVTQTAWFKDWLRGYVVREANQYLNGQVSIERLDGNLFSGLELEDVVVSLDGNEVMTVGRLELDYSALELATKGLFIDDLRLSRPVVHLRREGDTWSIARLVKEQAQEADREGPARPVAVRNIGISDGLVVVEGAAGIEGVNVPHRVDRIDAQLAFEYEPVRFTVSVDHLRFHASDPDLGLESFSGTVSAHDDEINVDGLAVRTTASSISVDGVVREYLTNPVFNLHLSSDGISVPEVARIVPALAGVDLRPAFDLTVDGPLDELRAEMDVKTSAGNVHGRFKADMAVPGQSASATVSLVRIDLAPILGKPELASDLSADIDVDLRGEAFADLDSLRGRVSIQSPRLMAAGYVASDVTLEAVVEGRTLNVDGKVSAYDADATASGKVTIGSGDQPHTYDLRGRARGIGLQRLPAALGVPPAETSVTADYQVRGTEPSQAPAGPGDAKAPARTVDLGLRFAESEIAGARLEAGSRVSLTLRGVRVGYQADLAVRDLDLQEVGRQFEVPALAADRFQSTIDGQVTANGQGTTLDDLEVAVQGAITDTAILGGRVPSLNFDVKLADDTATVELNGAFSGFDPASLAGREGLEGEVGGTLEVAATVAGLSQGVTADSVSATIRAGLEPSTIGGLAVERVRLDADYRDQAAEVREFEVVGRDLNVTASGTLALNESGGSDLTFHGDTSSLEELGRLAGVSLEGIAEVDGKVTGNRSELRVEGRMAGNGLKYEDNGALAVDVAYDVRLPDLAVAQAEGTADVDATFVSIAGQEISQLTAKMVYAKERLAFDASAKQAERSVSAAGAVTLHPDHQELHLDRIELEARTARWELAPGATAAIEYGGGAVTLDEVRLVNGPQQIVADGTFGRPGETLQLTMSGVGLEGVDALLLREPQLSGSLDLAATVSGTGEGLEASGDFRVTGGAFREVPYDSFGGTIRYADGVVALDTRLQQNEQQWITVKGHLPTALFQAPAATEEGEDAAVDLTVDSSPIALGLMQGFTTALTDVSGTVEAHLRLSGTAAAPQPSGAITIQGGALKVAATGVSYHDLSGNLDLQPDRLRIDRIEALDADGNALTLSGDLAISDRQLAGFQLSLNADDFKVLDNEMGEVTIRSSLEIGGDLRAPSIAGELGIGGGRLDLDVLLASVEPSGYATTPIETEGAAAPPEPGAFDALTMDVHIVVPDDLVMHSDDLRLPGSTAGVGALDLTLGGDVRALKESGGAVRLVGDVNTVRGTYDFQGRRFEILRDGRVRFQGFEEIDPSLDLRAMREIRGVDAYVNIRGTLRKPEIVLTSVPPLDEADVLALIVFNQPVNELGQGEQVTLAQRAQSLAAGAVVGQLAGSIGEALNLDTFEINFAPEGGSAADVTFGEQVGENLYIRVQQGIGERGMTNFVLEYELTKWLRLRTNVLQGSAVQQSVFRRAQGSGLDLIFLFSY